MLPHVYLVYELIHFPFNLNKLTLFYMRVEYSVQKSEMPLERKRVEKYHGRDGPNNEGGLSTPSPVKSTTGCIGMNRT